MREILMRAWSCSKVDTSILNNKDQAPLHLAVELNRVAVLQVMAKHKQLVDTAQGGEHGRTALHIAAILDHDECARILVSLRFFCTVLIISVSNVMSR